MDRKIIKRYSNELKRKMLRDIKKISRKKLQYDWKKKEEQPMKKQLRSKKKLLNYYKKPKTIKRRRYKKTKKYRKGGTKKRNPLEKISISKAKTCFGISHAGEKISRACLCNIGSISSIDSTRSFHWHVSIMISS